MFFNIKVVNNRMYDWKTSHKIEDANKSHPENVYSQQKTLHNRVLLVV